MYLAALVIACLIAVWESNTTGYLWSANRVVLCNPAACKKYSWPFARYYGRPECRYSYTLTKERTGVSSWCWCNSTHGHGYDYPMMSITYDLETNKPTVECSEPLCKRYCHAVGRKLGGICVHNVLSTKEEPTLGCRLECVCTNDTNALVEEAKKNEKICMALQGVAPCDHEMCAKRCRHPGSLYGHCHWYGQWDKNGPFSFASFCMCPGTVNETGMPEFYADSKCDEANCKTFCEYFYPGGNVSQCVPYVEHQYINPNKTDWCGWECSCESKQDREKTATKIPDGATRYNTSFCHYPKPL